MDTIDSLPPLPDNAIWSKVCFSGDQMREYASAAVLADRATREIDAPGLVFMVAYGDKRDVRGMFDTSEQAHAFVARLDSALKRGEVATPGGGLPGDHNGEKSALLAPQADATALAAPPAQPRPSQSEDARDAARYRWLREQAPLMYSGPTHARTAASAAELDAATDAAMKEPP